MDFHAFDTETVNRPGRGEACLLLKDGDDGPQFLESPKNWAACFNFLAAKPARRYVAWNMDFDARAHVHPNFLPWSVCESLGLYGRARYKGYSFRYTPTKNLEVRGPKGRGFLLFDLKQFFGMSLEKFAEKHCPEIPKGDIPKSWYSEMDACLKDARRAKVLSYGIRDVEIVRRALSLLLGSLSSLGMKPRRLSSCASLARLRYGKTLEKVRAPDYLNSRFERGFFGGRIECATLGHVENVALYDINSAYPAEIAKLKDPSKGVHVESREDWRFNGLPDYGLYALEVSIPRSWHFGPLAMREAGKVFFPVGHVKTWAGAGALALIRRLKLPYKIRYAYEIFGCPSAPLFPDMGEMYAKRKGSDVGLAIKLTINSLYGLMAESTNYLAESIGGDRSINGRWHETRNRYGRLTNFVLASHITEAVRLRLWETARASGAHFMATDSVLIPRGAKAPEIGPGLGEWSLKGEYGSAVILGCGRYALYGDKPEFHLRGFPIRPEIFDDLAKCKSPRIRVSTLETKSYRQWSVDSFAPDLNVLSPSWRYLEVRDDKRYWSKRLPLISDYFSDTISSQPYIVGRPGDFK